jgi:hypothetical protein
MQPMPTRFRPWLSSGCLGFIIGVIWEAFGNTFLWTLASPQMLVYLLALTAWFFLGLAMAVYLRLIERFLPGARPLLKPLVGPAALIPAGITRDLGLITYPDVGASICGVPLYMMTGWLSLVYVMDWLGWHRTKYV